MKCKRIGDCSFAKNITLWSIACDICGDQMKDIVNKKEIVSEFVGCADPFYTAIQRGWIVEDNWFAICPKCLKSIGEER